MSSYVIRSGQEGKRRLKILARILWPTTFPLLKGLVREGMSCLDLGCGGGDVTIGMARLAGSKGKVVGIDVDAVKLAAAREEAVHQRLGNVEFRDANVFEWSEDAAYDLAYARFLLTHLGDPGSVVVQMRHALRPGGILVVEDIDFNSHFATPGMQPSTAMSSSTARS
ncbi:MAG TPA: class I SAM-dependent methyltransferase [Bryobacterales bacterium]|nr:class I SAM-dependent methyltransferase [Bryobacterales bacterium]